MPHGMPRSAPPEWVDEHGEVAPGPSKWPGVYFLLDTEEQAVKVGSARDIHGRLCELQIGSARPLVYLGWIVGGVEEECAIGEAMREQRLGESEWYRMTPAILQMIRDACRMQSERTREQRAKVAKWIEAHRGEALGVAVRRHGAERARLLAASRPLEEALRESVQLARQARQKTSPSRKKVLSVTG